MPIGGFLSSSLVAQFEQKFFSLSFDVDDVDDDLEKKSLLFFVPLIFFLTIRFIDKVVVDDSWALDISNFKIVIEYLVVWIAWTGDGFDAQFSESFIGCLLPFLRHCSRWRRSN